MKKSILLIFLMTLCLTLFSCKKGEVEMELEKYKPLTTQMYNREYTYLNDENNVLHSTSYNELMSKLEGKDTFLLYIGGYWCPNCQAIIHFLNEEAKSNDKIIYNFDTRIASTKEPTDDIRNCNNEAQTKLYSDLINILDYQSESFTPNTEIYRMSVPAIFAIKEGKVVSFISNEYLYDSLNDRLYLENDETNYKEVFIAEVKGLIDFL